MTSEIVYILNKNSKRTVKNTANRLISLFSDMVSNFSILIQWSST